MRMLWLWKDPSGVLHGVTKGSEPAGFYGHIQSVKYFTDCKIKLSVDDINKRTKVEGQQVSCMRCMIAPPDSGVIEGE